MRYHRPERPNPVHLYKGFLINSIGGKTIVFDIAGKRYAEVKSVEEAQKSIDAFIDKKWKRRPEKKNPAVIGYVIYWKQGAIRRHIFVKTIPEAREFIAIRKLKNYSVWEQPDNKLISIEMKNPLTPVETKNLKREAAIHGRIGGTPKKRSYYRGIAEGMLDAAEQYGMNPPVQIYSDVLEIVARKGPRHNCDAACKRAGHTYRHKFTKAGTEVLGNRDGSITLRNKR